MNSVSDHCEHKWEHWGYMIEYKADVTVCSLCGLRDYWDTLLDRHFYAYVR